MTRPTWRIAAILIAVLVLLVVVAAPPAVAQSAPAADAGPPGSGKSISLWSTIKAGGVIGMLIVLMSLVSVALVIEHFLSIRRNRIVPAGLEADLAEHLKAKDYDAARALCESHGSFLANVMGAGLAQIGAMFGFFDMQNAMQEVAEREVSKLYRKLEYLSFIAATAPMCGLLGTVTGMITAFNQIAQTEGTVKPSQLAGGISEALVTTCLGLVVAIPTMFFVAFFRSRIDSFVAEAETVVERLMSPFRRGAE